MRIFNGEFGAEAPTVTNAKGGKQSATPVHLTKGFPHKAVLEVGKIIKRGIEKYGANNWRLIQRSEHLNHAMAHLFAHFAGDDTDTHLENAACRILFALETSDEEPEAETCNTHRE